MKKTYVVFLLFSAFLFLANSGTNPTSATGGYTGAPGDGYCGNCHTGSNPNLDGEMTITDLPAVVTAGQTYSLTVTITNPNGNASRAGFQILTLDENDDNAGEFENGTGNSTVKTVNGKSYYGHQPSTIFPGSNTITFTVDWTPDAALPGDEEITFYGVAVIANGGNGNSQDRVVDASATTTIEFVPDPLEAEITDQTLTSCFDSFDGSATVTAMGGVMPYEFEWDNGETTATAVSLTGGMHSVTVTDQDNNTVVVDVTIETPSLLAGIEISNTDALCFGSSDGSVTVSGTGGTGNYSYLWPDGNTTDTNNDLEAGLHIVIISDENDCETEFEVTVEEPDPITLMTSIADDLTCFESNDGQILIEPQGGTGSYSYIWSNGETDNFISNLEAGDYSVEVIDANLCTAVFNYTINQPTEIIVTSVETNASCDGVDDGLSELGVSGGAGSYSFNWSNGETGNSAMMLPAGESTVTVTDADDCMVVHTVNIDVNENIEISLDTKVDVLCFGESTGSVTVQTTSTENLTYTWSNGEMGMMLENLEAGTYEVIASADSGCESNVLSIDILQPDALMINTMNSMNVSCNGASDGSVEIEIMGGTGTYTVMWSDGQTGTTASNLPAGEITATITDENNCTIPYAHTVEEPAELSLSNTSMNNACFGEANGSISLEVIGGTGDYTYAWSNGATSSEIMDLEAGTYSCEIMDENGCIASTGDLEITEPSEMIATENLTNETSTGSGDGTAEVTVDGGSPDYEILWSNGETTFMIENLASATYTYVVTDSNGCQIDGSIFIGSGGCILTAEAEVMHVSCFTGNDGSISLNVENFTDPLAITWSNGVEDELTIENLSQGFYNCTITDGVDCEFQLENIEITEPGDLGIIVTEVSNVSEEGATDGFITVDIEGGTLDYLYEWYNASGEIVSIEKDLIDVGVGEYYLVVIDGNDCTAETDLILIEFVLNNDNFNITDLSIFPNPTQAGFYIEIDQNIEISNIKMLNANGQVINTTFERNANSYFISTNAISSGMYFIEIVSSENERVYGRVMVE